MGYAIKYSKQISVVDSLTGEAYTAWDVSNVETMKRMLEGNSNFNQNFNQNFNNWRFFSMAKKEMLGR